MSLQEGIIPDSVSLSSLSDASACSSGLTEKCMHYDVQRLKEGSCSCSQNLARFGLGSARGMSEQGQRKQLRSPQKSLLELITEDECFMSHHPIEKSARVTSIAKYDQKVTKGLKPDTNDQHVIKVKPRNVPLKPLSLVQLTQQEKGTSNMCNMPGELHFNPFSKAQTGSVCSSKELSLSDLAKLSNQAPSSLRPADVEEKNTILSDLSSHYMYKIASSRPNLSHVMEIHVVDFHSTTSVGSASSAPPAISAFKPDIAFHRYMGLSIKGKSNFFALVLSHPTEDSVPHSLSRLRQCIDGKLIKDYINSYFKVFDFCSQSPDDIVLEKQHSVFQR